MENSTLVASLMKEARIEVNDAVIEEIKWVKSSKGVFPIIVKKIIPNLSLDKKDSHFIGIDPYSRSAVSYTGTIAQKPKN